MYLDNLGGKKVSDATLAAYKDIVAKLTAEDGAFALKSVSVNGTRSRVYACAAKNLGRLFSHIEDQFSGRDLVDDAGRHFTYGEIFNRAKRLAGGLQAMFGVSAGENVGIAMSNQAEWLASFLAITWAGGVAVLFNSRSGADELAHAAATVACPVIIADVRRAAMLTETGVASRLIIAGQNLAAVTPIEALLDYPQAALVDVDTDAPAAILFTSGTTGRPKGAVLTHRNFANMAANLRFLETAGIAFAGHRMGIAPDTLRQMMPRVSVLVVFPFFHISGITAFLSAAQSGGMLTILPRWRADTALGLIVANKVTMLSGPPLIVSDLLDHPGAEEKLATVNNIAVGGQATPTSVMERVGRALPMASQSCGWGMTEVCGSVSAASGAVLDAKTGTCGLPSPLTDLRVVDATGHDVPPGTTGELWLRSALVMAGYWNAPEANAAAFEDGWYKTGDIGFVDEDGFIYLVDRKKDMVICGGENIYCAEVERVLSADEAFAEISIFGVPDERLGERAVAAVTLREGHQRSEEDVKALARVALADYKVPSSVVFDLGPFPRNATGKVNKSALRTAYLERLLESI
jgi:acyl-CoA synthetase (AMP-forming)/AMP-acid ligase II